MPFETRTGEASITHVYTAPGNYYPVIAVSNAKGRALVDGEVIVGTPIQLECSVPEIVSEKAGTVAVSVRRTGDPGRRVSLPRVVQAAPLQLSIPSGSAKLTFSLTPAHDVPATLVLSGDGRLIELPPSVTVPPNGQVTIDVHALQPGATAISATPLAEEVRGVALPVDI